MSKSSSSSFRDGGRGFGGAFDSATAARDQHDHLFRADQYSFSYDDEPAHSSSSSYNPQPQYHSQSETSGATGHTQSSLQKVRKSSKTSNSGSSVCSHNSNSGIRGTSKSTNPNRSRKNDLQRGAGGHLLRAARGGDGESGGNKEVVIEERGGKARAVWRFYNDDKNSEDEDGDAASNLINDAFEQTVELNSAGGGGGNRREDPELRRIRKLVHKDQAKFSPGQEFRYAESDFALTHNDPGDNDEEIAPEAVVGFSFAARRSPEELAQVINKRVEILYSDHKTRALRREALVKEKQRMEEQFYKMQQDYLVHNKSRKQLSVEQFHEYWTERVQEYKDTHMIRQKLKEQKDALKAREELAECTFKPDTSGSERWQKARQQTIAKYKEKFLRMAELQQREIRALEDLHTVEASVDYNLKLECEKKMEEVLQENPSLVDRFLSTAKGQTLLSNRTKAYMEANPDIGEERAEAEATSDILAKSRENIRDRVLDDYRARRIHQRRALAIRKLHVVVELQRLEHEYTEMALNVKGDKTLNIASESHRKVVAAMKGIEADYARKFGRSSFAPGTRRQSVISHGTESFSAKKVIQKSNPHAMTGLSHDHFGGDGPSRMGPSAGRNSQTSGTANSIIAKAASGGSTSTSGITAAAASSSSTTSHELATTGDHRNGRGPGARAWGRRMAGDPLEPKFPPNIKTKTQLKAEKEKEEEDREEELRKRDRFSGTELECGLFFQTDLVGRLKQEPWFLVAKHAAAAETVALEREKLLELSKDYGELPKFDIAQCAGSHMA